MENDKQHERMDEIVGKMENAKPDDILTFILSGMLVPVLLDKNNDSKKEQLLSEISEIIAKRVIKYFEPFLIAYSITEDRILPLAKEMTDKIFKSMQSMHEIKEMEGNH